MNYGVIFESPSLSTPAIALIIVVSVAALFIILEVIIKKKNAKILQIQNPEEIRIKKIIDSKISPEKKMEQLSEISKAIFREKFNFSPQKSFSELSDEFKKINNPLGVKFCSIMAGFYYSQEKPTPERTRTAAIILDIILKKPHASESAAHPKLKPAKEIDRELEKISSLKHKVEAIIAKWGKSPKMRRLEEEKSKEKILELISKNQSEYNELKQAALEIKKAYLEFNSLLSRVHEIYKSEDNRKISKLISRWKKENRKILRKSKNPFKNYSEEMNLLDKYLAALGIILTKDLR